MSQHAFHSEPALTPPPTRAIVDLSALAHNLEQVRRRISRTCDLLAVVKADAYGHGAVPITEALAALGVRRFGVATVEEGIALRNAGVEAFILVMGALLPDQCADVVRHRLTPIIHDSAIADSFAQVVPRGHPYPVHVKVDTGMGRLGLPADDVLPLLRTAAFAGPLSAEGLMTHLADADSHDTTYTHLQLQRFQAVIDQVKSAGIAIPLIHAANSAGILFHSTSHFTLVRPGLMLYGYHTASPARVPIELKPVLTLVTRVVQVRTMPPGEYVSYNRTASISRPSRIAVLPIGYADGYSRLFSNRGAVLIKGRRASIIGRVCMDMTMVDVTDIHDVAAGDEVVLIGRQGQARLTAAHLASWSQTIPYEVLCALGPRVKRVYRSA